MILSNKEIYILASNLKEAFSDQQQILSIKFYFPILKNKKILINLAEEIEQARNLIFQHYGTFNNQTQSYHFPEDKIDIVNNELENLLSIKQDVLLMTISLEDLVLEKISLTTFQIEAIAFMIQEKKEVEI